MNKLTNIKHYKKEYVRAMYGKLGKSSGLNPGVLWPRREELQHKKQYDKAFQPTLESLIMENNEKKTEQVRRHKAREEEVLKNLQKLPQQYKQFFDKIEVKEQEKVQWLKEREALIEEVREVLGFRAKPTDERFQQALAQKEEDEQKARRKEQRKKRENASLEEMLSMNKDKKDT